MAGVTDFRSVVGVQGGGSADVDKIALSFDKLTESINKANDGSKKLSDHPGFDSFASKVKSGISDPLASIGGAAQSALQALGPVGTGVAAAASTFAAFSVASYEAAKALGSYATELSNVSVRTGLSVKEVEQFSFAARVSGQDVTVFETAMRKLSQGLDENNESGSKARKGLVALGISAGDVNGKALPMSSIFIQISEALNRIEDPAKRDSAALEIFGRAGVQLLPTLLGLSDQIERAKSLGGLVGPNESEIAKFKAYQEQIVEVDLAWEKLKRDTLSPIAGIFSVSIRGLTGDTGDFSAIASKSIKSQIGKVAPEELMRRLGIAGEAGIDSSTFAELQDVIQKEINKQVGFGFGPGFAKGPQSPGLTVDTSALTKRLNAALRPEDEHADLEAAKTKLKELQGAVQAEAELHKYTPDSELAAIENQKALVAGIEAQIRRVKELEEAEKSLLTFEIQMHEKNLNPVDKIFAQRDELVSKGANSGRATDAALFGAVPALKKMTDESTLQQLEMAAKSSKDSDKQFDEFFKPLVEAGLADSKRFATAFIDWSKETARVADEISKIQVGSEREQISARSNRTLALADLRSGPGQEGQAIASAYQERIRLAKELFAFEDDHSTTRIEQVKAEADLKSQIFQADMQHELAIAELQKKRLDDLRSLAGGLFDSLLQGPKGIEQFFTSAAKNQGSKIFQNLFTQAFGGVSGHLGSSNPLFAGTLLGKDPLADATLMNTLATESNTAALRAQSLSPSGGGGSASGGWGTAARNGGIFTGGYGTSSDSGDFGGEFGSPVPVGGFDTTGADGGVQYGPENYDRNGNYVGTGGASGLGRGVGIAGAVVGGGFGIYSGLHAGGPQGGLTAAGSAAGLVGSLASLIPAISTALPALGPIGLGLGAALGLVSSLIGDPKKNRADELTGYARDRQTSVPTGTTYSQDLYGRGVDTDYLGHSRSYVTNNFNLNAMDGQSLQQFLIANPGPLAAGIANAAVSGNGDDMLIAIRQS